MIKLDCEPFPIVEIAHVGQREVTPVKAMTVSEKYQFGDALLDHFLKHASLLIRLEADGRDPDGLLTGTGFYKGVIGAVRIGRRGWVGGKLVKEQHAISMALQRSLPDSQVAQKAISAAAHIRRFVEETMPIDFVDYDPRSGEPNIIFSLPPP